MHSVELVLDAKNTLGEGPAWDHERKLLYWVDIMERKIWTLDPKTKESSFIEVDQMVGAVVPKASGGFMVAARHGFYQLNSDSDSLIPVAELETDLPNNRFNDGKCDARGRFWAGTMDHNQEEISGALYCLDTGFQVRKVLDSIGISNGLAWDKDHRTMYYIDSVTKRVVAFDYELESGQIRDQRTVVTIPEGEGIPDGMTIDDEGMLWVAQWEGSRVSRWNPATGQRLDSIPLPASRVTSVVFGGENLDELYITTARVGLSKEELEEQPHAGGLFRVKPGVKGSPTYRFEG